MLQCHQTGDCNQSTRLTGPVAHPSPILGTHHEQRARWRTLGEHGTHILPGMRVWPARGRRVAGTPEIRDQCAKISPEEASVWQRGDLRFEFSMAFLMVGDEEDEQVCKCKAGYGARKPYRAGLWGRRRWVGERVEHDGAKSEQES